MPSWIGGRKVGGGAEVPLLGSHSGSLGSSRGGGGILWLDPPLRVLGCLVALLLGSVCVALLRCSLPSPAQPYPVVVLLGHQRWSQRRVLVP